MTTEVINEKNGDNVGRTVGGLPIYWPGGWFGNLLDRLSGKCEFKDVCGYYKKPGSSVICDNGGDEYCGKYRRLWKEKHSK